MLVNPSSFYRYNVADTCSVWNVLSSLMLYSRARQAGVLFICTHFVIYECLHKPRKKIDNCDLELQRRLKRAQQDSAFVSYSIDIADLQTIELLENRKRLGKGELSAIAFALKTGQAFITDDQKARKLAQQILQQSLTQTTPHLVGWLFYTNCLSDGDKDILIREHKEMGCTLGVYFEEMYHEAYRCKFLMCQGVNNDG